MSLLILLAIAIGGAASAAWIYDSKRPFLVLWRDKLALGGILIVCTSFFLYHRGFMRHHTVFKPIESGSPAAKYLGELRKFPSEKQQTTTSPDGALKLEHTIGPAWTPIIWQSCHTLSLVHALGSPVIVFRAAEADPGSGSSFSWSWSKDSKAVFVIGEYSALDCFGRQGRYNMIYTVDDGVSWTVPE